jgi:hypothetical protein
VELEVILEEVEGEEEQEEQALLEGKAPGGTAKVTDEDAVTEMAEIGARTVVFGFGSGGDVQVGYVIFSHFFFFPFPPIDSLSFLSDSNTIRKCSEVRSSQRLPEMGSRHASVERSVLHIHLYVASSSSLGPSVTSSRLPGTGRERCATLWL